MELITIAAQFVTIHCYLGAKTLLFETFEHILKAKSDPKQKSNTKIVFLVYNMSLKEYSTFYEHLKQAYNEEFKQFFINILMVKNRAEAQEHISHIRKVNQAEFQYNYLKLQEHSEKTLRTEVLESYIYTKFKWNKVKTKYFLEKNNIASMKDLLEYDRLPYFEKSILEKTKQFRDYCESAIAAKEGGL